MTDAARGAPSPSPPPSAPRRAIVLAGGEPPAAECLPAELHTSLGAETLVVAADSGLDHALALGLPVAVVVGDLDSASDAAIAAARAAGVEFEAHPTSKDATDLELALVCARDRGARRVTVLGGGGGRHDHLLANALVLAAVGFADLDLDALVGTARITVVRGRRTLCGQAGTLCSLLAVGGIARGIRTTGLRYPLHGEDLLPGSTRGVSNELVDELATVTVEHGVLLAVQPHALTPPVTEEA